MSKRAPGRPFVKGQSGNPKGRPKKGESVSELIALLGSVEDVTLPDGRRVTRRYAVAERLWQKAIREGDTTALKFLVERLDGKDPIKLQAVDEDGEPTPTFQMTVIQKRSFDEWDQAYKSGSPSPDKPKPSRAPRSNSSLAARKGAGKATSSSGTT